jgi:hypothetical protein
VFNADDEKMLRAFGDWLGARVGSRNGDCWFYLSLLPDASGNVMDFYRELDRYLKELGYERGLDDEMLNPADWSREPTP